MVPPRASEPSVILSPSIIDSLKPKNLCDWPTSIVSPIIVQSPSCLLGLFLIYMCIEYNIFFAALQNVTIMRK